MTSIQEHRICAELCMSGLGGEPCGSGCLDVVPQGIPTTLLSSDAQSTSDASGVSDVDLRRTDACPVLCANRLGYPLCNCNYTKTSASLPFFKVNYFEICSKFCITYNYQIYGCATCDVYTNMTSEKIKAYTVSVQYNWNEWCVKMCKEGDGGSACYCDLLPLGLKIE